MEGFAPPGWPPGLPGPGAPGWQAAVTEWLLDQAPPSWRTNPRWRRYPVALAWLTGRHLRAQVDASRASWSDLPDAVNGGALTPDELGLLRAAVGRTGPELVAAAAAADLVYQAMQGGRFIPRL